MNSGDIISRIPITGFTKTGGDPIYANKMPILNADGVLDSSFIQTAWETKTTTGNYTTDNFEGRSVINTYDSNASLYADGAWRVLKNWSPF